MRLIDDDTLGIVCLIQEAEGEPYDGKVAVAEVILRRTKRKFRSDGTVAGTVLRKYQFSGMNTDAPNRTRTFKADDDDPSVRECRLAWEQAKRGSSLVPDCMHYYNPKTVDKEPLWAYGATVVAKIGNHVFVIPKGG